MSKNPHKSAGLQIGAEGVNVGVNYSVGESAKFPYGCPYCGRENVCAKRGNSCGRSECNQRWTEQHRGVTGRARQVLEFLENRS